MKKTLWKQSSRSLRMEQLENRELLSATTWSNAIDADAAVAAEMSTALSNATVDDVVDLTLVTTLQDKVDATDGIVSLREALQYIANDATLDGTITFAPELDGQTITLTRGELQFTNNSLATIEMPNGRAITIDASGLENGITIDAHGESRVFNVFATQDADPFVPTFKNLTIVNGAVTGDGAAIYADGYTVTLADCNFEGNVATGNGGAVYAKKVTATNSTFANNEAGGNGGALYVNGGANIKTLSTFADNNAGGDGGAIYNNSTWSLTVKADFSGNSATNGGAVYTKSSLTVTGDFTNNTADTDGGAIWTKLTLTVIGNFTENTAGVNGGAIWTNGTSSSFTESTFDKNTATTGAGGAIYMAGSNSTFKNLTFTENTAGANGGAVYVYGSNNAFDSTSFTGNTATADGGAVYFNAAQGKAPGSARQPLTNLTFDGNQAGGSGGAIYGGGTSTMFENLTVVNNTAGVDGGGLYLSGQLTNALIADNTATGKGGGVYGASGQKFYNVTIAGNKAASGAGVSFAYGNSTYGRFYNSIILNNFDANGAVSDIAPNVSQFGTARPLGYNVLSSYDDWCSDAVGVSENVIVYTGDINNVFTDAANGDYTLKFSDNGNGVFTASPAIGAGNNAYVEKAGLVNDLAGNARVQKNAVDLGAFETPYAILAQPNRGEGVVTVNPSISETLSGSITIKVDPQEGATAYSVVVGTKDGWIFDMKVKELGAITETTSVTFDDLLPNEEYIYWVLPIGGGEYATPELANPLNDVYTTESVQLATPKLDELVTLTANSISFDFAQDNQGKASNYFVLYQKVGDAGWKFSPAKAGETFTIDGLEIGGTYNVMAVAYGDNVTYYDSLFSNAYTFTTPKYDLAAPSIVVGEVGKSASINEGQVTVVVGDVEFATNYAVYYTTENPYAEDGSLKDVEWTFSGAFADTDEATHAYTATGLKANTTYWFRAEASADETYYNSSVSVVYASATTAKVYLQAPTLALTQDAYVANDELTTSITATFNAVDNAAGYRIYWTTDASKGLSTWNSKDVAADVSEYKIEGLAPNQKYNVRVVALSDNDAYLNSNTEGAENKYLGDREITTVKAQLAAPTFTVEGVKANREALLVTIAAVNKADKYNVSWVDDQGETQTVELTGGALTYTIEGLTVGTKYAVTVEAIGAEAYVASTATEYGKTLLYDMPSGLPTISVVDGSVTDTTVEVEVGGVYREVEEQYEEVVLDENGEPALDENGDVVKETKTRIIFVYDVATEGYKLQYKLADSEDWTPARDLPADLVGATYTVEDLCPNCKYDFRVVANETKTHYGKESASASATMKYGVLATPTFTVTADTNCVGSSSVTINIDAVANATAGYTVFYKLTDSSVWAEKTFDAAVEGQIEGQIEGLSPNKSYDFLVYANDTGHYAPNYEDGSVATTVKTERAKLNDPVYTLTGADKALTVNIEEDPNAVFYVVQYCKDGTDLWTTVAGAVRETSYTITGLEEGTKYHVRLQAFATSDYYSSDIVEQSGWTNKAALAVPGISVVGAVSSSTTSSVKINLTASEGANRYEIYYRVDGTSEWTTFNAVVGSNTIENLAPNKLYWFTAKAFNDAQPEDTVYASVSAEAEWQYKSTPKGSFDLTAPGVVEITKGQDFITVNVNREEGCDANYPYYLVQYKGADGQWIYNSIDATQLSYTITGLNPGETYEVQVEAFAANQDDYNDSTVFETTVTLDKAGQLAAPTVSVYSVDGTAITVMVQGDVAVDTNGYVLQYATNADFSDAISVDAVFGANQINVGTGRTYYFRAQAKEVTEYSASDWAVADGTVAIKPQTPGEIGFTQYRGGKPGEAVDLDGTWLRVKWDYCENDVEYVLSYRVSGTAEWTTVNCPATLVNPTTGLDEAKAGAYMYDLQPGVSYDFMVYAVDPNNADNISDVSFATFTMMDAPEVSVAFDAATGMINVSWIADENIVATKYRVEVLTAPFESVANVNKADNAYYHCGGSVAADQTSYSFDTLNASQTYYIRVSSYVGSNMSAWTYAEVKFDAPTDLTFAQYQGFTRVKWADVANESGYRVEYRAVGETEWTVGAETKADVATAAIYGLNAGTTYQYRVVATFNGVEGVAASDVATFDCLATPEVKSTALNKSGNRIVFAWFGVEGVDSYRVECSTSANFDENVKAITTSGTNQSFAMEAGKTYYFRVRANQATSKEGWSNWSEVAEFTAPAADVVSEAFVDLFAEEAEDDFWFEFEEALGGRSK